MFSKDSKRLKFYIFILLNFSYSLAISQNSSVRGLVLDALTNEPLPYATVKVVNEQLGTATNEDGNFLINNLNPGFVALEVSFVGYTTIQTSEILLTSNQTEFVEILLEPQTNNLASVSVRPANFIKRDESPLSMQSIGKKEIESNPGSNRDVSRVIQAFPGVGSTPAFRNDIIIRGGGPSENRFYLDDVEIPVLNHFATQGASGGPVGIINADFVRNINFYSSTFPAEKYNALSGVLDFKQRDGNADKTGLQFAVGASEASITLDGPISKKTTYIFSVRRSYLQFLFSAIGLPFLPTFNDYQLKTKTRLNKNNQLTIISIGSLDHLNVNSKIKDPTPSQKAISNTIPTNNQWSYTIGAVYKHFFKKGYHTFVLSRNKLNNQLYKYPDNDETANKIFDYTSSEAENKFRYELHFRHSGFKYVFSANTEYAYYDNQTEQKLLVLGKVKNINYKSDFDLFKYGFSGQATRRFFYDKLLLSFGFRFDGNDYNSRTSNLLRQFSPRFAVSYEITNSFKLNAGLGRYYQQNAYTTMGYRDKNDVLVNKDAVKFIGLDQYNAGAEYYWSDKILISVEGFYKNYFNYPIELNTGASLANQGATYFVYGGNSVVCKGKGKAYGVELLHRINLKTFSLLASYTYFRSLFTNIKDEYKASSWDSRHLFSITASKKFKSNWQIGAKWRYAGSLPYTPYDLEQSAQKEVWLINNGPVLNNDLINSVRNKAFHQLDMRIDKNIFFKKWSLMIYFDLQNVYNFKNDGQDIIIRKKNPDGSYQTTNDGNSYVLESYKNKLGTILPTLGIMVKF